MSLEQATSDLIARAHAEGQVVTVQPLASHQLILRMLRLEHYRAYLRARAEEDDASGYLSRETARHKANRHNEIVAALSSCFPVGDTAERDARKGATHA